ncbi:MAG TPA: hypothetical protein VNG90_03100 [Candidatus Acidoferrum sp.]|nr:hypothetical protein [Candidatus Acidoferrum sp.]
MNARLDPWGDCRVCGTSWEYGDCEVCLDLRVGMLCNSYTDDAHCLRSSDGGTTVNLDTALATFAAKGGGVPRRFIEEIREIVGDKESVLSPHTWAELEALVAAES